MQTHERTPVPRRAVLKAMAAAPVALAAATPRLARAAAASPATSADDELIRLANRVARLAIIEDRLLRKHVKIEDAIADPPAPQRPVARPINSTYCGWSADGLEFRAVYDRPVYDDSAEQAQYKAALAAWERECDQLREEAGLPALARTRDAMLDRLVEAAENLTVMRPTTLAGLSWKSKAWLAIDAGANQAGWSEDLAKSIMLDVRVIGGAA